MEALTDRNYFGGKISGVAAVSGIEKGTKIYRIISELTKLMIELATKLTSLLL
jgi:hypothetical protein